jgi:hypothetical protein
MDERLLTVINAKTNKGEKRGYLTGILYLVPSDGSGLGNLCPNASAGCRASCLYSAGRGVMPPVIEGRMRKTRLFFDNAHRFVDLLAVDVDKLIRRANVRDLIPVVRLNGTSDIPWERMRGTNGRTVIERFPNVQFYDYTKRPNRDTLWPNYHLTFSLSEDNGVQAMLELSRGRNVAVVFAVKQAWQNRAAEPLPATWNGYSVVDGDINDLRFLDPAGVVVGLRAKGKAKHDTSGFVQIGGEHNGCMRNVR